MNSHLWGTSKLREHSKTDEQEGTVMATTSASTAEEEQIRAVIADRAAAMHDRDAERFVVHYAPQIVKFDLPPPLVYAGPQARDAEALRAWLAGHPGGPVGYEIRDLTVTVGGDVAFCHSLVQLGGALWFRCTLGLRKIDGQWLVTHEHNSTPFYMDGSDKAALDLQP
jgi:ketosteroid isomerase-like protein